MITSLNLSDIRTLDDNQGIIARLTNWPGETSLWGKLGHRSGTARAVRFLWENGALPDGSRRAATCLNRRTGRAAANQQEVLTVNTRSDLRINAERLRDRFLGYVAIESMANPDSNQYPSSPGQRTVGALLADELREIGLSDVEHDANGLVWATLPGNVTGAPVVALNAHVDTSPETSGANVKPQIIDSYQGGDITLVGDSSQVITVADNPELAALLGKTLITTDGTTLLGADDKAGLAIIMETVATLVEAGRKGMEVSHGDIRVLFTCDEEIGHGVDHVDLNKLAADVCYTLDGPGADRIDVETFSADGAVITFKGINIHPAIAKDRMVNAVRAASEFVSRMPRRALSPESTSDREGFLHPYQISGGVEEAKVRVLLRDFDTEKLAEHAKVLQRIRGDVLELYPGVVIDIDIHQQYRNLGDGLAADPRTVEYAELAHRRLGRTPQRQIIRGGTDGSRLTELGLPTPNLSSGQHNPHSPLEWACLDEMVAAVEVCVELAKVWAERK